MDMENNALNDSIFQISLNQDQMQEQLLEIQKQYVQIKCSSIKNKTIIQIIDISNSIMFDQQRAQNEFLTIINACVSHELRNPLNSISAQNHLKRNLYNKLKTI